MSYIYRWCRDLQHFGRISSQCFLSWSPAYLVHTFLIFLFFVIKTLAVVTCRNVKISTKMNNIFIQFWRAFHVKRIIVFGSFLCPPVFFFFVSAFFLKSKLSSILFLSVFWNVLVLLFESGRLLPTLLLLLNFVYIYRGIDDGRCFTFALVPIYFMIMLGTFLLPGMLIF